MGTEVQEQNENQESKTEVDPWALAFDALNKKDESDAQGIGERDSSGNTGEQMDDSESSNQSQTSDTNEARDGGNDGDDLGGLGTDTGEDSFESGNIDEYMLGVSNDEIEEYKNGLREEVTNRAIDEIAREFIKRGIRHTNGKLGASINDADICKRDEDGIPHFYNPDTGREFAGDNPRRQAQEWCDDYNSELADAFNKSCTTYVNKLMEEEEPSIAVLEFASTYENLDPIRQRMFDSVIEEYEIKDSSGDVIGYNCDLNKALNIVDRQVRMIQEYGKSQQQNKQQNQSQTLRQETRPALDIKGSAGNGSAQPNVPKSLAEAMEMQQDKLLADLRNKK